MEPRETPEIEKIVETVVSILKQSDLEEATEQRVRTMAADKLGIDPSEPSFKWIVGRCVETYVLALEDDEGGGNKDKVQELLHQGGLKQRQKRKPSSLNEEDKVEPNQRPKQDGDQVICKLSEKRSLVAHDLRGKMLVSFREYTEKNGKLLPSARGISLSVEEWSALRQRVPDIQAAVTKLESRIRSGDARKRMGTDMSNSMAALSQGLVPMEVKQIEEDKSDSSDSLTALASQGAISMETEHVDVDVSGPQEVIPMEAKQVEGDVFNSETKQAEVDVSKGVGKIVEADMSNAETGSVHHEHVPVETKQIEAVISKYVTGSATKGVNPMETEQTGSDIRNSVTTAVTQGIIPAEEEEVRGEGRKPKRSRAQMESVDKQKRWEEIAMKRQVKNERQIEEFDFGEHNTVINRIREQGLRFWFQENPGYNLACVREFYRNIVVPNKARDPKAKIVSRVGKYKIEITRDTIATYLGYRAPAGGINFPVKPLPLMR